MVFTVWQKNEPISKIHPCAISQLMKSCKWLASCEHGILKGWRQQTCKRHLLSSSRQVGGKYSHLLPIWCNLNALMMVRCSISNCTILYVAFWCEGSLIKICVGVKASKQLQINSRMKASQNIIPPVMILVFSGAAETWKMWVLFHVASSWGRDQESILIPQE